MLYLLRQTRTFLIPYAVLLVLLRRYLPVQAASQLVALVGAVVARDRIELWWLGPLAALAVGALVVVLASRLTSQP